MGTKGCFSCGKKHGNQDEDGLTRILIFGVTGMVGGSVAEGARGSSWYKVAGFTRRDSGEIFDEILNKGVRLMTGDMLNYNTVEAAMKDIDVVFLNTFYWDLMDPLVELKQGTNVVDAAMKCGVKHLIYAGTDYNTLTAQVRCPCLEGKAMVTDYIISVGIPYTIIRMGFFYENFISVFRPHPITHSRYAIVLPLHHVSINCGSIEDFGEGIARIGLRAGKYAYSMIHLASEYLTVTKIVQSFNNQIQSGGVKFVDGKLTLKAFKTFNFRGSQELTAMFSHYRTQLEWDSSILRGLHTHTQSFEAWLQKNEKFIQMVLEEVMQEVFSKHTVPPMMPSYPGVGVLGRVKDFTKGVLGVSGRKKSKKVEFQSDKSGPGVGTQLATYVVDGMGTILGVVKESEV